MSNAAASSERFLDAALGAAPQQRTQTRATVVGSEATLRGDIKSAAEVVIAGTIHGEIFSDVKIVIAEGGEVEGHIHAPEIVIDGKLTGDAHATASLNLGSRAEVRGDISTPSILITSGATFVGRCSMPAAAA